MQFGFINVPIIIFFKKNYILKKHLNDFVIVYKVGFKKTI